MKYKTQSGSIQVYKKSLLFAQVWDAIGMKNKTKIEDLYSQSNPVCQS